MGAGLGWGRAYFVLHSFNYSNMVRNLETFSRPAYARAHCKRLVEAHATFGSMNIEHNCEKCETNKSWQREGTIRIYVHVLWQAGCAPASLSQAQILMRETLNVIGFSILVLGGRVRPLLNLQANANYDFYSISDTQHLKTTNTSRIKSVNLSHSSRGCRCPLFGKTCI